MGDTSLVWEDIFGKTPVLSTEEALPSLTHLVVVLHHLQMDTVRKLLGLEHVLVTVTASVVAGITISSPHSATAAITSTLPANCQLQSEIIELLVIYQYIIARLMQCHLNWLSPHN